MLLYYISRTWVRKYDLTYIGLRLWYLVTISLKSSFSDNVIATEPITQERVNFNFQIIFRFVSICSNLHDCCPFRRIGFTYSWNLLISSLENTWFWESWCAIFTRVVYTSEEIGLWDTNRELCRWWPVLTDIPMVYDRVWPIYPMGMSGFDRYTLGFVMKKFLKKIIYDHRYLDIILLSPN